MVDEVADDSPPDTDEARILGFLQCGGRAVDLIGVPSSAATALLDAVLAQTSGIVLRVGNPLQTPLTLPRVLLQLGVDGPEDDDADALRRRLTAYADRPEPVVLAIDDAHTAVPELWPVLAGVQASGSGIRILLAGLPSLLQALPASLADAEHAMVVALPGAGSSVGEGAKPADITQLAALSDRPPPIPPPPPRMRRTQPVNDFAEPPTQPAPPQFGLRTALSMTPAVLPPAHVEFGTVRAVMRAGPPAIDLAPMPLPGEGGTGRRGAAVAMLTLLVLAATAASLAPINPPPSAGLMYSNVAEPEGGQPAATPAPKAPAATAGAPGQATPQATPAPPQLAFAEPPAVVVAPPTTLAPPVTAAPPAANLNPVPSAAPSPALSPAPSPLEAPVPRSSALEAPAPRSSALEAPAPRSSALEAPAPRTSALEAPAPRTSALEAPAPRTSALEAPAPRQVQRTPREAEAQLRREFNEFLRRTGWVVATPTTGARRALFEDYKAWLSGRHIGLASQP